MLIYNLQKKVGRTINNQRNITFNGFALATVKPMCSTSTKRFELLCNLQCQTVYWCVLEFCDQPGRNGKKYCVELKF